MKNVLKVVVVGLLSLGTVFGGLFENKAKAVSPVYCTPFKVKIGSTVYSGDRTILFDKNDIKGKTIEIIGDYVNLKVDADTFGYTDYSMTNELTGGQKTVIFKEKTPLVNDLSAEDTEIIIDGDYVRLSQEEGHKFKYQIKNCSQGGIFQIESDEPAIFHHELGDTFRYYVHPTLGKTMFTNGKIYGYESPEQARVLSMDEDTSNWGVFAGGRMGMVLGNDAEQYVIDYSKLPPYPVIGDVNAVQVLPSDIGESESVHQERSRNRTQGGKNGDSGTGLEDSSKLKKSKRK